MSLVDRLNDIETRIVRACEEAGRSRDSVSLVAVSKRQPFSMIRDAYALGVRDFGENIAQELRDKASQAEKEGMDAIRWHFIGRLQTNKVKYVSKWAHYLHSLDREELVEVLQRRLGDKVLSCFLQVNFGEEVQKGGVPCDEVEGLFEKLNVVPQIRICGLMTIPPNDGRSVEYYQELAKLRDSLQAKTSDGEVKFLSMGMSGDFETAIRCGSTQVRVGSALFGSRPG